MESLLTTGHKTHYKIGANVAPDGVFYRVWAPDHEQVAVRVRRSDGRCAVFPLKSEAQGYFSMIDPKGGGGDCYQFELPNGRRLADPASRFQPEGVQGPSECIDPFVYVWQHGHWERPLWHGQVVYELHLGTFTEAGTFRGAIERLGHIKALGAEAIQIMPVGAFAGERNWGYDGVCLFAPARCYGRPDDFRALVDAAHGHGLAVILDVVYNHVGPDGNVLEEFARDYFHSSRANSWGRSFNLDGPRSEAVRALFLANVEYWLDEYRIDGLRLDATHAIEDTSPRHLLTDIAETVHARGGFVIAEDERNAIRLLCEPDGTGYGIDAVWSDDFHHEVRVAVTGIRESYFGAYRGGTEDIAAALHHGWTYVGQPFPFWQGRPRGSECRHLPPGAFVHCIENHDQVGNRALGERLEHLILPEQFRAASALICLSPYAPLLFMGQEWAASTPFQFFTDHAGEVGRNVSVGRRREFEQTGLNGGIPFEEVPDPQALSTFENSKLRWMELAKPIHGEIFALYRVFLHERAAWLRGPAQARRHWAIHTAGEVVAIRYDPPGSSPRLLLVSLRGPARIADGVDAFRAPCGTSWRVAIHTEERRFGGRGVALSQRDWPATEDVSSVAPSMSEPFFVFDRAGAALLVAEAMSCP